MMRLAFTTGMLAALLSIGCARLQKMGDSLSSAHQAALASVEESQKKVDDAVAGVDATAKDAQAKVSGTVVDAKTKVDAAVSRVAQGASGLRDWAQNSLSDIDSRIGDARAKAVGMSQKQRARTDKILKQVEADRDRLRMNAAALQRETDDLESTLAQVSPAADSASAER